MAKIKHGQAGNRLYLIWQAMKKRCRYERDKSFKYYGGRGIDYHPSFETFEGFLAGIPDGYADHLEIDRIDTDGNYEPGNLKWSTRTEQMRNTRRTLVTVRGSDVPVSYATLAEKHGVNRRVIQSRISRGESLEESLRPVRSPAGFLTEDKVRAIKSDLWHMTREDVAIYHNVSISVVNNIYYQKSYREVEID